MSTESDDLTEAAKLLTSLVRDQVERVEELVEENARLRRRITAGADSGKIQVVFEFNERDDAIAFANILSHRGSQIIDPNGTVYFTHRQEAVFGAEIAEHERHIGLGIPRDVSATGLTNLAAQRKIG